MNIKALEEDRNVKRYNPNKHKLRGHWRVTRKLDGVQAIYYDKGKPPVSRAGKRLYNLPQMPVGKYEVFLGDWNTTVSAVRTLCGKPIPKSALFQLEPIIDTRLDYIKYALINPGKETIMNYMENVVMIEGGEGLVLYGPGYETLKVKPKFSLDVPVIGMTEGTGKNIGKMGALITPKGKVGSGYTEEERDWWWNVLLSEDSFVIEVECDGLTKNGQFLHPRYVRLRPDKRVEDCD